MFDTKKNPDAALLRVLVISYSIHTKESIAEFIFRIQVHCRKHNIKIIAATGVGMEDLVISKLRQLDLDVMRISDRLFGEISQQDDVPVFKSV